MATSSSLTRSAGRSTYMIKVDESGNLIKEFLPEDSTLVEEGVPRLVEVFNITYLGDPVEPARQLGSIKMRDKEKGMQYLYNVKTLVTNKPPIMNGDGIDIIARGPLTSVNKVEVEFDLFNHEYKSTGFTTEWEVEPGISLGKSSLRSRDGLGEIIVQYGLFRTVTLANLEVRFLYNYDNAPHINVYGVVTASNSRLDYNHCSSVLYAKDPDNLSVLGKFGEIPLSKSCVGVPLNSNLHVDISASIGLAYKASVYFEAREEGDYTEIVFATSDVGDPVEATIKVTVNWNAIAIPNFYDSEAE